MGEKLFKIKGKYNSAKVFADNLEHTAVAQIKELCNQEFVKESIIRIMPDAHAGAGCTIGTTMTITDKIVPNLVGVDIGCGVETVKLKQKKINLDKLDHMIHTYIPAGFAIRKKQHKYVEKINFADLVCKTKVNLERAKLSIGTLGGGNHFIEINKDQDGVLYLVVHSGSRHLGKQVAEYYQNLGYKEIKKNKLISINKQLAYVEGQNYEHYLQDMRLVQLYAFYNRKAIVEVIIEKMGFEVQEQFATIHNYLDLETMILRKGAVSAQKGEKLLIPINMRDGSLICIGKGNRDWNYSAPHGAGRLMSRRNAKKTISLREFEASMEGIYSSSVNRATLDECALAYKPMEKIVDNIRDTVEIIDHLKPIYNFKAVD